MFLNSEKPAIRIPEAEFSTLPEARKPSVPRAIRQLLLRIIDDYASPVAVNLWDVDYLCGTRRPAMLTLFFKHPGVLRNLLLFRDRIFLTECWLNNVFGFDGPIEKMIDFAEFLSGYNFPAVLSLKALAAAITLPALSESRVRLCGRAEILKHVGSDATDIQHHYDVGNDFYRLFLDPSMNYSCAHFENENATLEQAQQAKLDLICRKLKLQPGERLLDVGCGWGALLRWAAKNYGVTAYGITLSKAQLEFCRQRTAEQGLSGSVQADLLDYREISKNLRFDKIVSVGMIEHVGIKNYPEYFSSLLNYLQPGGLFLCHGITTASESNRSTFNGKFVRRYIFPGGQLANLPELIQIARAAGWETADVDAWRPHYVKTLRCWSDNLQMNMPEAIQIAGERVTKLWLLYMTASARGFEQNWLRIYQVLLRRADDSLWNLPLTRRDWLM